MPPTAKTPPQSTADAITMIECAKIRTDGDTQPRAALSSETVEDYKERLLENDQFPPVTVYRVEPGPGREGGLFLADGVHRLELHRRAGKKFIAAVIRPGSLDDCRLAAAQANALHGLPRSRADRQRSILLVLENPLAKGWAPAQVAAWTHTTAAMVQAVLMALEMRRAEEAQRAEEAKARLLSEVRGEGAAGEAPRPQPGDVATGSQGAPGRAPEEPIPTTHSIYEMDPADRPAIETRASRAVRKVARFGLILGVCPYQLLDLYLPKDVPRRPLPPAGPAAVEPAQPQQEQV